MTEETTPTIFDPTRIRQLHEAIGSLLYGWAKSIVSLRRQGFHERAETLYSAAQDLLTATEQFEITKEA